MKYEEYDPCLNFIIEEMAQQVAEQIDDMTIKAIQKVGVEVDKDKLLQIMEQDSNRYRDAYHKGYETGYEQRDDEIVRCRDCKHYHVHIFSFCDIDNRPNREDWFCADGERKPDEEE